MKKSLLISGFIIMLLAQNLVFGQDQEVINGPHIRKISVTGTRAALWVKANVYLVEQFNKANEVVHFIDKDAGVIAGKYAVSGSLRIFFVIQADNNLLTISANPDDQADVMNELAIQFVDDFEEHFKNQP